MQNPALPLAALLLDPQTLAKELLNKKHHLVVSADAEIKVKPDRAAITFGIFEKTQDLKEGKEKMQNAISKAIALAKTNGIEEKHIQTENIYIAPKYSTKYIALEDGSGAEVETLHYEFSQTFKITLVDTSKYDTLLYGFLDIGINRVENVTFYSTEMGKHKDEARIAAVKNAKEKAALLTTEAGIKLGKAVSIQENGFNNYYNGFGAAAMMNRAPQNISQNYANQEAPSSDLAPGMIAVKASVTITYELD